MDATHYGPSHSDARQSQHESAVNVRDVRVTSWCHLRIFMHGSAGPLVSSQHDRGESRRIEGRVTARVVERSSLYVQEFHVARRRFSMGSGEVRPLPFSRAHTAATRPTPCSRNPERKLRVHPLAREVAR